MGRRESRVARNANAGGRDVKGQDLGQRREERIEKQQRKTWTMLTEYKNKRPGD
jgi:hypothetical protein